MYHIHFSDESLCPRCDLPLAEQNPTLIGFLMQVYTDLTTKLNT